MMTLVIPAFSSGPNIERTIKSCEPYCDETVIISTAIFPEDNDAFHALTPKVVELPWNFTFLHGFGSMSNQGTALAKNKWMLLLGIAETVHREHRNMHAILKHSVPTMVFKCDHINDQHTWKRIWNKDGGAMWSGIIHEEITFGVDGGLLFEMRDTDKTSDPDPFRTEVFKYLKSCCYNWLYVQLRQHPERLGGTNAGWLNFVAGNKESNEAFCTAHGDLISAAIEGNRDAFLDGVRRRMDAGATAKGVNFNPQGQPMSAGA